jgi:hypothetical protein
MSLPFQEAREYIISQKKPIKNGKGEASQFSQLKLIVVNTQHIVTKIVKPQRVAQYMCANIKICQH